MLSSVGRSDCQGEMNKSTPEGAVLGASLCPSQVLYVESRVLPSSGVTPRLPRGDISALLVLLVSYL